MIKFNEQTTPLSHHSKSQRKLANKTFIFLHQNVAFLRISFVNENDARFLDAHNYTMSNQKSKQCILKNNLYFMILA